MELKRNVEEVIFKLEDSLDKLSDGDYSIPLRILSGASIGQHVRHIIELFSCLINGYENGLVNYEKRKRDPAIESDKELANKSLGWICHHANKANKALLLELNYDDLSDKFMYIETNFFRELAYNLEHAVHHMALIRIGVQAISSIQLPEDFGVASSTVKYRKSIMK